MPELIGEKLGRYQIIEQLGEGGMATVYKAYDTRLEREVAIKIIRRSAFPPDQLERILQRFEREAKTLARLSHPNIVKVYDFGEYEGAPYLVLEYMPGGTLKQRLSLLNNTAMPWREASQFVLPIARALQFAHVQGIVHRDIKPSNILIAPDGQAMLSDFGIAKLLEDDETTTLTGAGIGVGTPEYMAPEQWTGEVSPQSDQYSLGVVLYEMVTGHKPFQGDTPASILLKQATEPLTPPRQFTPGLPAGLEKFILKALTPDPAQRFLDMQAFVDALQNLGKRINSKTDSSKVKKESANVEEERTIDQLDSAAETTGGPVGKAGSEARIQNEKPRSSRPASRRRIWIPLASLAGLLVLGAITYEVIPINKINKNQPSIPPIATTIQATATLTVTPVSPTSTATTFPTPTSTPSAELPVLVGMPLPGGKKAISVDNYQNLAELAIWGSGPVNQVGWTPNNEYLAVGSSTGLTLYGADGGSEAHFYPTTGRQYYFSPDASIMAFFSTGNSVVIRNVSNGTTLATIGTQANSGTINILAISPDNKTLATGSSIGNISLWRVSDGTLANTFSNPNSSVTSLAFSPDGKILAAGYNQTKARDFPIFLWNISQANPDHTIGGHQSKVTNLLFSPDGKTLASASDDGFIFFWGISTGAQLLYKMPAYADYSYRHIGAMAFSPDSTLFAYTNHHATGYAIWLMRAADGTQLQVIDGHTRTINSLAFSSDNQTLVSGSDDCSVRLWKVPEGNLIKIIRNHTDQISALAFSLDGSTLATGSDDNTIHLWHVQDGTDFRTIPVNNPPTALAFDPGENLLACGFSDGKINFIDVSTGSTTFSITRHYSSLAMLRFSIDGNQLLSADTHSVVYLWQMSDYQNPILTLQAAAAGAFAAPTDLSSIASNSNSALNLWQVSDGKVLFSKKGQASGVISMAFSPDGNSILTGSNDHSLMISSASDGSVLSSFTGSTVPNTVIFSSDGSLEASGGNGSVDMWLSSDNSLLRTFALSASIISNNNSKPFSSGPSLQFAFSPDGAYLAFGLQDGTIRIWGVP